MNTAVFEDDQPIGQEDEFGSRDIGSWFLC